MGVGGMGGMGMGGMGGQGMGMGMGMGMGSGMGGMGIGGNTSQSANPFTSMNSSSGGMNGGNSAPAQFVVDSGSASRRKVIPKYK